MNNKELKRLVSKKYKEAKKTLTLGNKKYFLYCALSRKERYFKDLIPLFRESPKNIKILLDVDSDICLVYGSKDVIKTMRKRGLKRLREDSIDIKILEKVKKQKKSKKQKSWDESVDEILSDKKQVEFMEAIGRV